MERIRFRDRFISMWPVESHRATHSEDPRLYLMPCCHYVDILNNFIFEFLYCKCSSMGQRGMCVSRGNTHNMCVHCHSLPICLHISFMMPQSTEFWCSSSTYLIMNKRDAVRQKVYTFHSNMNCLLTKKKGNNILRNMNNQGPLVISFLTCVASKNHPTM